MSIDCHAHWIPPKLAELLRSRQAVPRIERVEDGERFVGSYGSRPFDAGLADIEIRRELMKQHRVSKQVLSLAGLFGVDCLPADESAPLVAAFNEEAAQICRLEPESFVALAALPLADSERACYELERAHKLGLRGAILPASGFVSLAAAKPFGAVFAVGNRLRSHFFIHPGPLAPVPEKNLRAERDEDNAWQRRIVLETQAVLSSVMMTLNLTNFFDPYPNVTVQVANLGGTIPFVLERMDEVHRADVADGPPPSRHMGRCYVDTASFGPRAIELAVACYGADRILLGTDCPIFDVARMLDALRRAHISSEERELIMKGNAQACFGGR
jgi:predicted TIM-barrel fold metal-dependent hydrolase